jgi:hypothetical protein
VIETRIRLERRKKAALRSKLRPPEKKATLTAVRGLPGNYGPPRDAA